MLRGARAISEHLFGDGSRERAVYELRKEFPIFKIGRLLFAYADDLDEVLARKEQAALDTCRQRLEILTRKEMSRLAKPVET
jgi:hypothetical protein